jgi:hypothetical protein
MCESIIYTRVPPKMLMREFRFHKWTSAVKTAATSAGIPVWGLSFKGALKALKANTVIATGGTTFSTKARNGANRGETCVSPESRKNRKGKTRQKKITPPMIKVVTKASLILSFI